MDKQQFHEKIDPSMRDINDLHQSYSIHFNENYKFSKNLIEKLVHKTILTSFENENKIVMKFPSPPIQEKPGNLSYHRKRNDLLSEVTHQEHIENLPHVTPSSLLPNDFLEVKSNLPNPKIVIPSDNEGQQQPSSPVFIGGQLLPEYQTLKSKVTNSKGTIDLSNQNFGNHRIVIFSETLAASKDSEINNLSLRGNRLTDVGICEIVQQLSTSPLRNLLTLDLSSNKIGRFGAIALGKYLKGLCFLQRLNLSSTNLGDNNACLFLRAWNSKNLTNDQFDTLENDEFDEEDIFREDDEQNTLSLISLRLANNKIETLTAKELAKFLKNVGSCLAELDLSWNELRAQGASYLLRTLSDHPALTSLDISWNSMGIWNSESNNEQAQVPLKEKLNRSVFGTNSAQGKSGAPKLGEGSCAQEISRLLSTNNRLLHLNIAQNKFSPAECEIMSQGLQNNHTLLGIHITGNCCRMDNYGSMCVDNTPWPLESSHISEQIIKDTAFQSKSKSKCSHNVSKGDLAYLRNSCWICESWQEVEFSYQLSEKDMEKLKELLQAGERAVSASKLAQEKEKLSKAFPVHMFASFDNWIPERMLLREKKEIEKIPAYVHQTLKRAEPSSNLSPSKPTMPPPSHLRRLSVNKNRHQDQSSGSTSTSSSLPNRNLIRRRTSIQHETISEVPKNTEASGQDENNTSGAFLLKSETFTYDSSDEEADNSSETNNRKLTFANTKYLLHSFESGHWSMMGDIQDDSDDDEDFVTSLLSHPTTGMKISKNPGPGVFLAARGLNQVDPQRPVYSLRRMVPPGRHAYVFSVGTAPDNIEDQSSFIVFDPSQPHNSTASVVSSEKIKEANDIGIDLPETVNTLFIFDRNPFFRAKMKNPHVPEALKIGTLLSLPRSAKPRTRNPPILQPLRRIWHESDSILYQQYLARQQKQLMECFQCDWGYGKTCKVFGKDEDELSSIKDVLMKYYSLLLEIYTYYSSVYSGDVAIGLGGMAYNKIILQCYILEPLLDTNSSTLTKSEFQTEKQALSLYSTPQKQGNSSQPHESQNVLTLDTSSPPISPTVPRPSVRATLLLKQIHVQTAKSPSFIKTHGLDGYSSYQASPQKNENNEDDDLSDAELENLEMDSDLEDDDEFPNIDDKITLSSSITEKNKNIQVTESTSLPSSRAGRQPLTRGRDGIGSIGRAEVDMIFVSGCVSGPKVATNHKRTLARFQFLDAVVSLSCLKYIESQICFEVADAVEKFCVEILGQYAARERDDLLLPLLVSKPIDDVLRTNSKDIEKMFRKFAAGSDLLSMKTRLLSFSSWQQLLQQNDIRIGERTQRLVFGQSKSMYMRDVLNELYDTKNLYYMEFLESIVRIAFLQRKEAVESGMIDQGGLSSTNIASDLENIIKKMKIFLSKK